jgi:hypothetical protein
VPGRESSLRKITTVRVAIQMVLDQDGDEGERRRADVARIVLNVAGEAQYDAATLASLALERMATEERRRP